MLIELTLICALAQPPQRPATPALPPDHQVALVLGEKMTVFIRLDDARRLHRALTTGGPLPRRLRVRIQHGEMYANGILRNMVRERDDGRVLAALVVALGTLPDRERLSAPRLGTRERLDWEVRRGVHLPTQKPEPVRQRRVRRLRRS